MSREREREKRAESERGESAGERKSTQMGGGTEMESRESRASETHTERKTHTATLNTEKDRAHTKREKEQKREEKLSDIARDTENHRKRERRSERNVEKDREGQHLKCCFYYPCDSALHPKLAELGSPTAPAQR